MSTLLLESAIAQMFPPNLTIYRQGWVWRNERPTLIDYVLGYDETGHPYMHEVDGGELEMTPMDAAADLQEKS